MSKDDELADLELALQKVQAEILKKDVAPIVEKILKRHIKTDIYDAYTPQENAWVGGETYKRRHSLQKNITSKILPDGSLLVTSTAYANKAIAAPTGFSFYDMEVGGFLHMLEDGHMGIWKSGFPRPAVSNAQRETDESAEVRAAIEKGIQRIFK